MSEARTEDRLGRLETDVAEIKTTLGGLMPMIIRIDATLPHLATKADLAEKPCRAYLWGVMAAMVGAQAVALAAAALIFSVLQARPAPLTAVPHANAEALILADEDRPYSCRLFDDEQRKCAFGSCDMRTVDRLRNECLRDGGRP